jgi:catechol 2,3-dioxygenase-like lactoylglutathione lyase family enzyme
MSTTGTGFDVAAEPQDIGTIDYKLEVITIPVSDVGRAKSFYERLGWRVDADVTLGHGRLVQMTPPRSDASIHFGAGITTSEPGAYQRLMLAVSDIEAAREDLIGRGVDVSEPFHLGPGGNAPGPDPEHGSYNTYASFSDPDGNGWLLQEVTTRRPGRLWES